MSDLPIKRLMFEAPGGDDDRRIERTRKGVLRETTTPYLSVPFSQEGTRIQEYVDRNDIIAGIKMRNQMTSLIVDFYPVIELSSARLVYNIDYTAINQLISTNFLETAKAVPPETY